MGYKVAVFLEDALPIKDYPHGGVGEEDYPMMMSSLLKQNRDISVRK